MLKLVVLENLGTYNSRLKKFIIIYLKVRVKINLAILTSTRSERGLRYIGTLI